MKCKYCNGTGTTNWCVNGTFVDCPYCGGTGEIKVTNEEWFCQLPTEEKATWLEDKMTWAAQEQGTFTAKGLEKWLKEIHE
jgi:hypothetical protein